MTGQSTYHRENLKDELLAAAVRLVAETGARGFTLREVARRAGVSHNAPYRHFRDRQDLLLAVAAQGFDGLTASMQAAIAAGKNAKDRLRLCGQGYLEFALRCPEHIQVMFDLPKPKKLPRACREAGERAFQTLLDCVVAVQAEGSFPKGDPLPLAYIAWSGIHGLAKLTIAGQLPFRPKQALDFSSQLAQVLQRGLAVRPA